MRLNVKLFLYYFVIFFSLIIAVALFQYDREKSFRVEQLETKLTAYNNIIYKNYLSLDSGMTYLLNLMPDSDLRVTIVDTVGLVIFDSSEDILVYDENHLMRPEIQQASKGSFGRNVRCSSTNGNEYYYFAERFDNMYIRSALPYNVSLVSYLEANLFFIYFIVVSTLIVIIILILISSRIYRSVQDSETRLKRELTQNISHELKTPVAAILGYTESIVQNPNLEMDKKDYFIQRTYQQSHRLNNLLQDISTINRLADNPNLYEKEQLDLVAIIYEVLSDTKDAALQHNVDIQLLLPPDLIMKGNKSLLYSLFRNLFDNVISYAGDNIELKVILTHSDPFYYYFVVGDNGCGVAEEHLPRLFERFYRIDKGRSRKIGGTGLGLAIVKNAVIFHSGKIEARKHVEKGLDFIFNLHR